MTTIYVSIGNSDDRLTQSEWSEYVVNVSAAIHGDASTIHGAWFSPSASPWQNACWCFEINDQRPGDSEPRLAELQRALVTLRRAYDQNSIAWARADTEMI